jgi:rubrerythrin
MEISPNLTVLEILGIAIKSEIDSVELYQKLMSKIKNKAVKDRIMLIKQEEIKHRQLFENLHHKKFPEIEIKVPKTSIVPKVESAFKQDLSPKELLEIAMENELASEKFYSELQKRSPDITSKGMLQYLSKVEQSHYRLLKDEYEMLEQFPNYLEMEDFLLGEGLIHLGP